MLPVGRYFVLVAGGTAFVPHVGHIRANISIGGQIGQARIGVSLGADAPFPDQEPGGAKTQENQDPSRFFFPPRHDVLEIGIRHVPANKRASIPLFA